MKIYSPVKDYTGVSASVPFCNGVGETDDPHLLEWFKNHGYQVEEPTEEQAKELAEEPTEEPAEEKTGKRSRK